MRDRKVAVRYAVALLGSVKEAPKLDAVAAELNAFSSVYRESAELRRVLSHPGIPFDRRKRVMGAVCKKTGASPITLKALEVVLRRGRISVVGDIADSFSEMIDEKLGRQNVKVSSAFALSADEVKALEKVFSATTGRAARVEAAVDPSLIGGLVARVGSRVYDGSVRNQLGAMKSKLEQEA